jgi:hypothetical protein
MRRTKPYIDRMPDNYEEPPEEESAVFLEPRESVEVRQAAARKWLEAYGEKCSNAKNQPKAKTDRALMVIVLSNKISDFLAEHDPQALKHAQEALTGESWEKYMPNWRK